MQNTETDIRKSLLAVPKRFDETEFEIEGQKVLIRKPSIKERNDLQKLSIKKEDGEPFFDHLAFRINSIISCCIDKDTRKPIFQKSDYGTLLSYPTGSWVDKVSEKIEEVLYVDLEERKKD